MKKAVLIIFFISYGLLVSQQSKYASGRVIFDDSAAVKNALITLEGSLNYVYANSKDGSFKILLDSAFGNLIVYYMNHEVSRHKVSSDSKNIMIVIDKNNINKIIKESAAKEKTFIDKTDRIVTSKKDRGKLKYDKGGEADHAAKGFAVEMETKKAAMTESSLSMSSPLVPVYSDEGASRSIIIDLPHSPDARSIKAGLLTAGEVNDFSKWKMWNDIAENELSDFKSLWKLYPQNRYSLQLTNEFGRPVFGAKVRLLNKGFSIWSAHSDNTGKCELWFNPFINRKISDENITLEIEYNQNLYFIQNAKQFSQGVNFYSIKTGCLTPKTVDISFVVDATGSMGDEINYLKKDLQAIINEIKDTLPDITFNLGSVFYKDTTDDYMTVYSDFNSDIKVTSDFIEQQSAQGGGDYPEAVQRGLDVAINHFSWNENSIAKIIFLVLDAPPHENPEVITEIQKYILKASEKGIRVVPISCSGINKKTEYLLRSIALLTNGTYTFITDDSGIGSSHIAPSTDEYDVETLNQLIRRIIYQYSYYPECSTKYPELISETLSIELPETGNSSGSDENIMKYYPNPTFGELNIEINNSAFEVFICDINGKILMKLESNRNPNLKTDLSEYPAGMYFLLCRFNDEKWSKGGIMLMH